MKVLIWQEDNSLKCCFTQHSFKLCYVKLIKLRELQTFPKFYLKTSVTPISNIDSPRQRIGQDHWPVAAHILELEWEISVLMNFSFP